MVATSGEKCVVVDPSYNNHYNISVDVNTELPLITMPIKDCEDNNVIGVLQVVHMKSFFNNDSLNKEYFEQEMLDLFCDVMSGCIEKSIRFEDFRLN